MEKEIERTCRTCVACKETCGWPKGDGLCDDWNASCLKCINQYNNSIC